jgi:hypothetical protein
MKYMRVTTYYSSGVQISDSYATTGSTVNAQTTVGVGIPQLNAISGWVAAPPVFAGAAYYVVTFGIGFPAGPTVIIFIGNIIQKTYRINTGCCNGIRLHWLNSLGGVDSYRFSYRTLSRTVAGDVFQKPLSWNAGVNPPHLQSDYGKRLTNIVAERQYELFKQVINSDLQWIVELLNSAEIYLENPNDSTEYWSCYVVPATFTEKTKQGFTDISFNIILSQDIITHRR